MQAARRLRTVWRTRGPLGFGRFVASRLVGVRHDLIFAAATGGPGACRTAWQGPGELLRIERANVDRVLGAAAHAQVFGGEGADYLDAVRRDALLLAVVEGDLVLHHSFVLFDTRTKRLLGEARETPLFAHCVTHPRARGQRLYPRVLGEGLGWLAAKGYSRAVINCDAGNVASIRGIEHAGFERVTEARTWTLLGRLGLQRRLDAEGHAFLRAFRG